ncbi:MAG TPA: beta-N-acetylhexosaminidase [Anaerolineaceae bacterium]|nr:beta-N-acetylhexosaminidase [Anaerolineaceae bacterium]
MSPKLSYLQTLIPRPLSLHPGEGQFTFSPSTQIYYADESIAAEAAYLAEWLGCSLPPQPVSGEIPPGAILLTLTESPVLGFEGYELSITPDQVRLRAHQPAGIFWAIQTLRQLAPAEPGTIHWPACEIQDLPRYPWRGMMLDVARHFFPVATIKSVIDRLALYKLNRLHLHLTDDQGWRLMIHSWPRLAEIGGLAAVGGDPGGYYTQSDYAEIVAYAQARHIMIIPEVDLPGHTNAALSAYAELNRDGQAAAPYTGTRVGFSSLCTDREHTYRFLMDVLGEIAAITPGPYLHIGGDEAAATPRPDYLRFIPRLQHIVTSLNKQMIGWEEISRATLKPGAVAQAWRSSLVTRAARQGARVILSPARKIYLDMKYNPLSPLGLAWAGFVEVRQSYNWNPAYAIRNLPEDTILGVEAPLWTETVRSLADLDWLVFPRLIGVAEIGWTPQSLRLWSDYRSRLAAHAPRLVQQSINFYRSPQVPWVLSS